MKICYGIQGTGNGHIARARIMAKAFALRDDIEVDYIFTGREPDKYFDMEVFGQYQTLPGLTFVAEKGRINNVKTALSNNLTRAYKDSKALQLSEYDLVLNDFEPLTAWAAKREGVHSISISHQASFNYDVPQSAKSIIDRLVMRHFAPCKQSLGVHWYHFNAPIIPPFIDEQPIANPEQKQVVVYLPFEELSAVKDCLTPLSEQDFIVFHPDIAEHSVERNLTLHPLSKSQFKHALQHSAGVIANAGFELSSEALRLGKKLLLKPLHGQFEQASNVITLERLGLCVEMPYLDSDAVEDWLALQNNQAIAFPQTPNVLVDWIVDRQWEDTQSLCDSLWKQVEFPKEIAYKLRNI